VGDWDGDGKDSVAAVRTTIDGGFSWALRDILSSGSPSARPRYGCGCAAAVAGDWDGDSRDSMGVARGASSQLRWQLKNANSEGSPDLVFYWGGGADRVMGGDWNGSGASRVGVRSAVAG